MQNSQATGFFHSVSRAFGPTERMLFYVFGAVLLLSGFWAAWQANNVFLVEVPGHGGTFTEGVVGSPRFVNPLLAISETDKSLVTLVYSGLLKHSEYGYQADIAEYYSISPDGLVYDVKLRDDAFFHDGKPVTTQDVQFTIEKALDPTLKSPRRGNWEGVAVEVIDDKNIRFVLKKPYYPFLENLTLGILPKHIWKDATSEEFPFSQFNIEPVGSGPYKVSSVKRNSSGIPTLMTLTSFSKYVTGRPYMSKVVIRFFQNEEGLVSAFESGSVDAVAGLSPDTAVNLEEGGFQVISYLMPRVFGVFFNQNQSTVLIDKTVRQALDISIDKQALVEDVLKGYGMPLKGPIPVKESAWQASEELGLEKARALLLDAGWEPSEEGVLVKESKSGEQVLSFSISTSDAPELKMTAEILASTWRELGAEVEVLVFESGDLNQNVIKPRKYDALLFGESLNRDLDLYPFWHSSQRLDPGLNIALYANITTDKLLDEMRASTGTSQATEKLALFSTEIEKDVPAVFTYAPEFIYAVSPKVKNMDTESISSGSSRFLGVERWYIETDKVWKVFAE